MQVQVKSQVISLQVQVKSQVISLQVQVKSQVTKIVTRVRLESKSHDSSQHLCGLLQIVYRHILPSRPTGIDLYVNYGVHGVRDCSRPPSPRLWYTIFTRSTGGRHPRRPGSIYNLYGRPGWAAAESDRPIHPYRGATFHRGPRGLTTDDRGLTKDDRGRLQFRLPNTFMNLFQNKVIYNYP